MDLTATFQEMQKKPPEEFIQKAIENHCSSNAYTTAKMADEYDARRNVTILNYVQTIYTLMGSSIKDFTASNNKITSNFFNRLNTQRNMYSLGNGISFAGGLDGIDETKEKLGINFDENMQDAAYFSLIHGVSFIFWNKDRIHVFPLTEFVPIWDENTGALRAGIRFWRLSDKHPMVAVLYEEDGYTKYQQDKKSKKFSVVDEKRAYIQTVSYVPADDEEVVIGEQNYSKLPIVPLWGSRLHQSTLVGMREAIDSYDLIRSGFANDLTDVSQVYWLIENAGGMDDEDIARFRDRMKLTHIASVNTEDGGSVKPYTQEIPFNARKAYLDMVRAGIYEDFGGLDVHTIAAGATNDHVDAAYQPMDEQAADFERQLSICIKQLLFFIGAEDTPIFNRARISNQKEQVDMVVQEAQWLDEETILQKLPNIKPEEIEQILSRKDEEGFSRFNAIAKEQSTEEGGLNAD